MFHPQLSAGEARRAALRAQGVVGAPDRHAGVLGLLERLSAVQLDTISVLARSHELVPYARLGPVGRDAVEGAYWSGADVFEYWAHAACLLPVDQWPRVLPPAVSAAPELDDGTCITALVGRAGRALGVATVGDLAEFHRLTQAEVASVVPNTDLVEVRVAGWGEPASAAPGRARAPRRARPTPDDAALPFDSLVWDRRRTQRMFGFKHRLEAYVPAAKRVHGYFAMPLLTGGRLAGRVDPGRDGRTLVARGAAEGGGGVRGRRCALGLSRCRTAMSWYLDGPPTRHGT